MEERHEWVDCAKAIGIVLVVYGHVARGVHSAGLFANEELFALTDSIVYSFHMPLFFFLSGLFFHHSLMRRGARGLMLNKVDTLVYPYALWSLMQGGIEVALSRYTNGGISVGDVLALPWAPRAQFWFLYALFFVFAMCALAYLRTPRSWFFLLLLAFVGLYLVAREVPNIWISGQLLSAAVFFAFGIWFNEVQTFFRRHSTWLAPVLGILFVAAQYLFHVTFRLSYEVGGWRVLMLAMLSILFVASLCMSLGRLTPRWLLTIGAASMSIYLMHVLVGSGVRIALYKVFGMDSTALHLIAGALIGLLGPLAAHATIARRDLGFLLTAPHRFSANRFGAATNAFG